MFVVGANTQSTPLVVDGKGRQIAGGEYGAVDDEDKSVHAHETAGRLILFRDVKASDEFSESMRSAIRDVDERNASRKPAPNAATTTKAGSR